MSIIIKGMEMPANCFLCPLSVLSENRLYCELTSDEVVRAKIDADCPLIELPPHGRLIDADATVKKIVKRLGIISEKYLTVVESVIVEEIKNAPTIIEAEE